MDLEEFKERDDSKQGTLVLAGRFGRSWWSYAVLQPFGYLTAGCFLLGLVFSGERAWGQVTGDNTLGAESSQVTSQSPGSVQIDGGATRGANLFHSFEQFSIPTGSAAYFNNAINIQNIISRVTGPSISNIDGLIQANGTANLFLINSNGIIFGPNASLNIGGSFLASTASRLTFGDGTLNTTNPQSPPLLTVSVPIGLQLAGGTAKSILNQSRVTSGSGKVVGLQVQPGKTLMLVGGDVILDSGTMLAPGGKVELGGLADFGNVGLSLNDSQWSLSFPDHVARADVYLTSSSTINVVGINGGSIAITARNINMAGNSSLLAGLEADSGFPGAQAGDIDLLATGEIQIANSFIRNTVGERAVGKGGNIDITAGLLNVTDGAQISSRTFGQGNSGSVTITAQDQISFDGVGSNGRSIVVSRVEEKAVGDSGDITVTTGSFSLTNGAEMRANTYGQGNAGSVIITARDTVSFDGVDGVGSTRPRRSSGVVSRVEEKAVGNSGDITVTTGSLFVRNGAVLSASTFGQGSGGSVAITARDTVIFDEVSDLSGMPSGAFSTIRPTAVGNGGSINITTESLSVINGARLSVQTRGQGDAGNITLNSSTLEVLNGGQVLTTSRDNSSGRAGNIILNVRDSVTIAGNDLTYPKRFAQFPNEAGDSGGTSGLFANTNENSTGGGGNLKITTGQLIVRDSAEVNVSSQTSGNAGELIVEARNLWLDQGKLLASTASGEGGNINLQVQDLITIRLNSLISAQAGGTANGGNITLNAPFIIAVPSQNSDIIANAVSGQGGNINITTQGIYGLESSSQLTPNSDINASSDFGVNGTVEINTLDIDPSQGLVALPAQLIDASNQIVSGCTANREDKFIISGRGGLPPSPSEAISSLAVWQDLRPSTRQVANRGSEVRPSHSDVKLVPKLSSPIIEAQGWVINNKGEVVLTAQAPKLSPHTPWLPPTSCHG